MRKRGEYFCYRHYIDHRADQSGCVYGESKCPTCERVFGKEPGQVRPVSLNPPRCSPCNMDHRAAQSGCVYGESKCPTCERVFGKEPGQVLPETLKPLRCSRCYREQQAARVRGGLTFDDTCHCGALFQFASNNALAVTVAYNTTNDDERVCEPCYESWRGVEKAQLAFHWSTS